MGFITGIIVFICVMCLLIIKGSLLSLTIFLVTKKKLDILYLFLPSLVSIIIHVILIYLTHKLLIHFDINVISNLVNNLLNIAYSFKILVISFTGYFIEEIFYIVIQAFILKLSTFNWIWSIKEKYLAVVKEESSKELSIYNSSDDLSQLKSKLTYFNRFIASLICSVFSFTFITIFTYIGYILGLKFLSML